MKKIVFVIFFLVCVIGVATKYYAQPTSYNKINNANSISIFQGCDTNEINKICKLAWDLGGINPDTSIILCIKALECSELFLNDKNSDNKLYAEKK